MDKYDQILTCKSWIVLNYKNGAYLRGNDWDKKRQIASLTKMYALYACLQINKLLNIVPEKIYIKIFDITTIGTLSMIKSGKYIKIWDLYFAMMLPSGNDAASLLAYYYGYWLDKQAVFPKMIFTKYKKFDFQDKKKHCNLFIKKFMHFINDTVIKKQLGHNSTQFQNPHGLSNKFQVSTAWQLAEAALYFIKNSKEFRIICKTIFHRSFYYIQSSQEMIQEEQISWQNTNILLKQQGYEGVKTGQTNTAGCCLATFKRSFIKNQQYQFIIIVLGCQTPEKRFQQTKIIVSDLQKYLSQITYS